MAVCLLTVQALIGGLVAVLPLAIAAQAAPPVGPPDAVFVNGSIATFDGQDSIASAVAVKNERFLAVG